MKRSVVFFFALVLLISMCACDTYAVTDHYPWNKASSWYCESIDFTIQFQYNEKGKLIESTDILNWCGNVYEVGVGFMSSNYIIYLDSVNGDVRIDQDEILLEGTWNYREGNLVFSILTDNLFDNQINELVFTPRS